MGFGRLALYGVGTIIGVGIYSVIGPAAEAAGDAVWISFLLAALISAFSGLSYAELASALSVPSVGRFPVTAGLGVVSSLVLAPRYDLKGLCDLRSANLAGALPYALVRSRGGWKTRCAA